MSLQQMREELRRRYERVRARGNPKPNSKALGRIGLLELLITVLKEHERSLDQLIRQHGLVIETERKRLEDLVFRLEEVVSRLERKI